MDLKYLRRIYSGYSVEKPYLRWDKRKDEYVIVWRRLQNESWEHGFELDTLKRRARQIVFNKMKDIFQPWEISLIKYL